MSDDIAKKQIELASDLKIKFFFHWAILSGATLTLIFPLLNEIKKSNTILLSVFYIKIALILLIVTLVCSSVRNYFAARQFWLMGIFNFQKEKLKEYENKTVRKLNFLKYLNRALEFISIAGYVTALVFLYLFISDNLFTT